MPTTMRSSWMLSSTRKRGVAHGARRPTIEAMKDELADDMPQPQTEPDPEAIGGAEEPEIAPDKEPGVTDFLKAAVKGAKRLKDQEP